MTRKEKFNFINNLNVCEKNVLMTVETCIKDFYKLDCLSCVRFYNLRLLYIHSFPNNDFVKISFDVKSCFSKEFQHVSFYYLFDKFMKYYKNEVLIC